MSNQSHKRDGKCLLDDWNFSTETVFRISKLLEDFRHEFARSGPRVLTRLGNVGKDRLEIDFVRRVFTSPEQNAALEKANIFGTKETFLCFQFTGSSVFESFRKSGNAEHIRVAFEKAADMLRGNDKTDLWSKITGLYRMSYRDTTLMGVLDRLEHSIAKLNKVNNDDFDSEEQFHLLSLLFVFYSRINIAGEASATVSATHFSTETFNDDFHVGCPQVFAYLLESESSITGTDNALLSIDSTGKVRPITTCPTARPHPVFFPDAGEHLDSINHQDIRKDFLGKCYHIFNQLPSLTRLFHLVVPVYETDDFSRDESALGTHVVAGPFLGWLYILLDVNMLRHLLNVSDGEDWESRWNQLCEGKLELACGIASDLQKLRFALNRFSELYLLGEMEWAIEQPWLEATDAAGFTVEHYYNCDGWMQDAEAIPSNAILTELLNDGYSAFCRPTDGILHVVPNTNQKDYISHIVVDVGRSFGIDEGGIGQPIPLLFKRRVTTSVPVASEDREFYRLWVTENIRRFYDLAKMREGERRAGRIANQRTHDQMVGHEMRKLTEIIRVGSSEFAYDVLRRQLNSLAMESEGHQLFENEKTVAKEDLPSCYDPEIADFWELLQNVSEFALFVHILKDKAKNTPEELRDPALSATAASIYNAWKAGMMGDDNVHQATINQGFSRRLARFLIRMLLAAVGNYFKHAERETLSISLERIPNVCHLLHFDNSCSLPPRSRNGTYAVLRYDLENYVALSHTLRKNEFSATDQRVWDALYFDKMKHADVFRTTLPLPLSLLSF